MDLKLVAHAKDYIDMLARGFDPLTGREVGENDVVNQVRISRCLFYVSEVLGEVLENGIPQRGGERPRPVPFAAEELPVDQIVSASPVTVSVLVKAVNAAKPENMRPLKISALTNWLSDRGFLRTETVNNRPRRRVTSQGVALGIDETERQGDYGTYFSIRYSPAAQQYLMERLPEIVADGYNDAQPRAEETAGEI